MNAIHVRKTITSPTLDLPELSSWVGKTVDIIVLESGGQTLDELAAAQGVKPITSIEQLQINLPADAFDGFDEALRKWRAEPWRQDDEP